MSHAFFNYKRTNNKMSEKKKLMLFCPHCCRDVSKSTFLPSQECLPHPRDRYRSTRVNVELLDSLHDHDDVTGACIYIMFCRNFISPCECIFAEGAGLRELDNISSFEESDGESDICSLDSGDLNEPCEYELPT